LVLAGLCVVPACCLAQASVKSQSADIKGQAITFNWVTGEFTLTGDVKVQIQGPNQATLTAPKMTGKITQAGTKLMSLTAYGPVRVEIITRPDPQGNRGRIDATATDKAVYSEAAQKIMLYGGAVADYVSLPEGPDSRRAHFTGDEIEADLNTDTLQVTNTHITVQSPLKQPEAPPPAPAAQTPAPAPAPEPKQ
jgi:lipopolysaccharide export system protein LptA